MGLDALPMSSKIGTSGQQSLSWGVNATVHLAGDEAMPYPSTEVLVSCGLGQRDSGNEVAE